MEGQLQKSGIFLLIALFIITSCSDDPASLNNGGPPALPPMTSMQADFDLFDNNQQAKDQANSNFSQAVIRALVMKAVVDINLAIPRALLAAAADTEAEFNEEGEWIWSYAHTAGGDSFEVRLVAVREEVNTVNWQFFITNTSESIENKLFFSGLADSEGRTGTWTYYDLQSTGKEPVSTIDWTVSNDDEVDLRLEVLSDRFGNQGDFIEYSFDGEVKNAVYYSADEDETTELWWNAETRTGYLIAPNYNNGEPACWDENFEDVSCG